MKQNQRTETDCKSKNARGEMQRGQGDLLSRVVQRGISLQNNTEFEVCSIFALFPFDSRARKELANHVGHPLGQLFFLFFALVTCVFAVAVVVSSNIVRMASYLVASLCGVAGLFFLAGAEFLGAMQLMLYVGGTVVLLIFGVMLTARGPFVRCRPAAGNGSWPCWRRLLLAVLLQTVSQVRPIEKPPGPQWTPPLTDPTTTQLGTGWSASAPTSSESQVA